MILKKKIAREKEKFSKHVFKKRLRKKSIKSDDNNN